MLGLLVGLAGWILALIKFEATGAHKITGILAMCVALLQPFNGAMRPALKVDEPRSNVRLCWEWWHRLVGVAALALAFAASFTGIELGEEVGLNSDARKWKVAYGIYLACFFALWFLLFAIDKAFFRSRRHAAPSMHHKPSRLALFVRGGRNSDGSSPSVQDRK